MLTRRIGTWIRYLCYWLEAVDAHSLHAPFIYRFYTNIINDRSTDLRSPQINDLQQSLLKDTSRIEVTDFGTGGQAGSNFRTVRDLATSSHQSKVGLLLYKIVAAHQPRMILELGTNLGLSTLSMAEAAPQANITTFEGCPNLSKKARSHFDQCGFDNIKIITGPIERTLSETLTELPPLDLVFIDANHRYGPTMDYFNQLLPKFHPNSILVLDDIHWSAGMERAWQQIIAHQSTQLSINLFQVGIVFFNPQIGKRNYVLAF